MADAGDEVCDSPQGEERNSAAGDVAGAVVSHSYAHHPQAQYGYGHMGYPNHQMQYGGYYPQPQYYGQYQYPGMNYWVPQDQIMHHHHAPAAAAAPAAGGLAVPTPAARMAEETEGDADVADASDGQ